MIKFYLNVIYKYYMNMVQLPVKITNYLKILYKADINFNICHYISFIFVIVFYILSNNIIK